MSKQKLTYSDAVTELENILTQLESNNDVNLEDIAAKVKQASELMDFCKKELLQIDKELEKMISSIED
ncbi:MAG: exodeoxyribonuclease VII small subunit [Paludibacter sp.]|nr:exodeoxyribonuclease VII small subunit [Paludibacter sp.]